MKFDIIKAKINEVIKERFEYENNDEFKNGLLGLADEDLLYKEVFRIKRLGRKVDSWKTLVLIEIEAGDETAIKSKLKKAITWLALIKENLLGTESTDLYLFLAFSSGVSLTECLRIESTEQFCRKYVLNPEEDVSDFVDRTFLQKLAFQTDTIEGKDPIERAFSKAAEEFKWLTPEMQKQWKKAFFEKSGIDLANELLEKEENT